MLKRNLPNLKYLLQVKAYRLTKLAIYLFWLYYFNHRLLHAKKVISALDEVKKVQQGKKAPKSFDDFLNEL